MVVVMMMMMMMMMMMKTKTMMTTTTQSKVYNMILFITQTFYHTKFDLVIFRSTLH
jgi:hypothetical protein